MFIYIIKLGRTQLKNIWHPAIGKTAYEPDSVRCSCREPVSRLLIRNNQANALITFNLMHCKSTEGFTLR